MHVYVLNPKFEIMGIIENYESSIWNVKYFECDDCELYVPATEDNLNLLKIGSYLVRDKDIVDGRMYHVIIIKALQIRTDIENGNYITATGECLKSILKRRIIWSQTNVYGTVETCLRLLIDENAINPANPDRVIPDLTLGEIQGFTETMRKQLTGDNLYEAVAEICMTYGLGWMIFVNSNKKMVFEVYKSLDRSDNQSVNPRVTFSPNYDTLLTSDYVCDYNNYSNVALIAGEGEGTARKTASLGVAKGLERYELYVDQRDTSSNDGEISYTEYIDMLCQSGTEALEEHKRVETFEGEVEPRSNFIYGVDYNVGDIVNVRNEYSISATPRITGVIESDSNEGESVIPTFSTWKGDN